MSIALSKPNLPAPPEPVITEAMDDKERIKQLEQIVGALINELDRYAYAGREFSNAILYSDRFGDRLPISGSGLVLTDDALGYFTAGKKITGTVTGTFVVSERVVQATTNAEGIVYLVGSGYIVVHPLTGTFTGTGSGATVTGQTSGATAASVTVTVEQAVGALIDSAGNFYFAGDDGNYIAWNGTALEVRGSLIADDLTTGTINGLVAEFAALDAPSNVTIGASQTVITSSSSTGAWWNTMQPANHHFTDSSADWVTDGVQVGDYLKVGTKLYYISYFWSNSPATHLFVTAPSSTLEPGGSGSITYTIIRASTSGAIEVDEDGTVAVPVASLVGNIDTANMQTNAIAAVNASSGTIDVDHGGIDLSSYAVGDMLYASGTTTLAKRTKGTAGQMLAMNAGATAPEWRSGVQAKTYTGDGSADLRTVATFDFSPTLVIVMSKSNNASHTRRPVFVFGPSGAVSNRQANGADIGTDDIYLDGAALKTTTTDVDVNENSVVFLATAIC